MVKKSSSSKNITWSGKGNKGPKQKKVSCVKMFLFLVLLELVHQDLVTFRGIIT